MNPNEVTLLMSEIEAADPLDFSELSIGEGEARELMAAHFCEIDARLVESGLDAEARLTLMTALAAHTMEANFLAHLRALSHAEPFDLQSWMRHRGFGAPRDGGG